jgi:hypothetical protein
MNVFDKLNADVYKNTDPYPVKREVKPKELPGYKIDKETHPDFMAAKEEYREAQKVWQRREYELQDQFKRDLLEHLGITGHPKADLLYSYAWSRGHSSGLHEVANCALDLVELIKD